MTITIKPLHYFLSFLAGATLLFAFEPFNITPLASLTPAALFYLLLHADTRRQHIYLSWAFGLGMFTAGTHWVFYSIHFFGHAHWTFALLATFLFALMISAFLILVGLLSSFVKNKSKQSKLLLIFPAIWVLVEAFRGWFLTGFPWLLLGQSQIDTLLGNIAPVFGVYGVTWLSAILAGAAVLLLIGSKKSRITAITTAITVLVISYTLGLVQWTSPTGEAITVSVLQGNIPQEKKWEAEHRQPTLDLYREMTEKSWDSDLIVWPETAIPDWFGRVSEDVIEPLRAASVVEQSDLIIGGFHYDNKTEKTYNSIMAITQDGDVDIYSKRHLVIFGEYIPLLDYLRFLEKWVVLPYDSVGRGKGKMTLKVANQLAQMSICYEDVYGDESITGLPEATMLINITNDGWFTGSIQPMQHMQIARMRALESGRYMLRATNIGISGIIDEKGRIIHTADPYTTAIIKGKAQGFTGATPYVIWGNWFILLIMLVIFGTSGFYSIKNKQ